MKKNGRVFLATALMVLGGIQGFGQTADYSLRSAVNFEFKVLKNLKWEVSPEFRINPSDGSATFLAGTGFNYKLASWLSLGASYRLEGARVASQESSASITEYSNRFALDAISKLDIGRFTPKFRVRFSNFTDFDNATDDRTNYMRYRIGLGYNIKGIKLNPYVLAEFYQKTSSGLFSKGKYTIGASYDLNKHHGLSAEYSYADKFSNLTRYHIFEVGYSLKF
jgi:hypothetical protein